MHWLPSFWGWDSSLNRYRIAVTPCPVSLLASTYKRQRNGVLVGIKWGARHAMPPLALYMYCRLLDKSRQQDTPSNNTLVLTPPIDHTHSGDAVTHIHKPLSSSSDLAAQSPSEPLTSRCVCVCMCECPCVHLCVSLPPSSSEGITLALLT